MNNSNNKEICLRNIFDTLKENKKSSTIIIIGTGMVALLVGMVLPKQYESTTVIQTRSADKSLSSSGLAAAAIGISTGGASGNMVNNYIELMKSRTVVEPIIDSIDWESEKDKPEVDQFIKKNTEFINTKQTNIIKVVGKGRTPEEAKKISEALVDNFISMQTDMSRQTNSLLVVFLNERIETAKKDYEDAAEKLAQFQKEHKIYDPGEQTNLALTQLNAFDKAISDMEVQQRASQAQYDVCTQKLNEQKVGALNYNINDNSTVKNIRENIVLKELELVELKQKFTDSNPVLISAQKQLEKLKKSLSDEVSSIVNSNAASLNTAQMELLKNQAIAQAQLSAAKASEETIREKKKEKEQQMDLLPNDMMTFVQLQSDSNVKKEIYMNLVIQVEQKKIEEAKESMDVQIVDHANLPDEKKPAFPKKKIFVMFGLMLGAILTVLRSIIIIKSK